MKMLIDGIGLYILSGIFLGMSNLVLVNLFSVIYVGNILWILFSLGYLYFWFYYGYKIGKGFLYGLIVGSIGSGIGILVFHRLIEEQLHMHITPWFTPLLGVLQFIPKEWYHFEHTAVISFLVVVFLTGLGSDFGNYRHSRIN